MFESDSMCIYTSLAYILTRPLFSHAKDSDTGLRWGLKETVENSAFIIAVLTTYPLRLICLLILVLMKVLTVNKSLLKCIYRCAQFAPRCN